jgi:2-dehydropantoate 2-reductase
MSFFNPPNYIGAMAPAGEPLARELAERMTEAGLETHFTTEIKLYEWKKAILNAAMASVCALTRKTMREMMEFSPTEFLVEQLMREGIEVAQGLGFSIGAEFFADGIQYLQRAGYHKPSMLQDIERGVTTEIAWINGKIVEWGQRCGMETPYNRSVVALVSALEMRSQVPEES